MSRESLVKKRKGTRFIATRAITAIKELLQQEEVDHYALEAKIATLTKSREKLNELNEEIQAMLDETEMMEDMVQSTDRDEAVSEALSEASSVLKRTSKASETSEDGLPPSSVRAYSTNGPSFQVQLPKLQLPFFSGGPFEWTPFWDNFRTSIHSRIDLMGSQKLSYLRGQLKGEPFQLISGFPATDLHYNEAVDLLTKIYGRKHHTIRAHLHAIFNIEEPKPFAKDLRAFMANYECHIRSLKNLEVDIESAGYVYVELLMRKLPLQVKDRINRVNEEECWTLPIFRDAIEKEIRHLADSEPEAETASRAKPSRTPPERQLKSRSRATPFHKKGTISTASFSIQQIQCCPFCEQTHKPAQCEEITDPKARKNIAVKKRLCFNCLSEKHSAYECNSPWACRNCGKWHHTSLCFHRDSNKEGTTNYTVAAITPSKPTNIALPTAMLAIKTSEGVQQERALFDQGSQRTFISTEAYRRLGIKPCRQITTVVNGFGNKGKRENYKVIDITVITKGGPTDIEAIVTDQLPTSIRNEGLPKFMAHLRGQHLSLADPYVEDESISIALIVGADFYYSFIQDHQYLYGAHFLSSSMGHLLTGPIPNTGRELPSRQNIITVLHCNTDETRDVSLKRLWDLESIGIIPQSEKNEDAEALAQFDQNLTYKDGQYTAKLPWKRHPPKLPTNYGMAVGRLENSLKRLRERPAELEMYDEVFKEQLQKGFIELVKNPREPSSNKVHYVPHLPVWRDESATTPLRVVFDCSAGVPSLNDCLVAGPPLNHEILQVLMRFRLKRYACLSDIAKAYLMIALHPSDRDVTRFLWPAQPKDPGSQHLVFRFKVILFGATSSQFILNATIRHHLQDRSERTADAILRNIYVDNIQASANSEKEIVNFYQEAKKMMAEANLHLREWVSNSSLLNQTIKDQDDGPTKSNRPVKILGMVWDPRADQLCYPPPAEPEALLCKRTVVREMAKTFDPIGFLAPITILERIFIQKLWTLKLEWDELLDNELAAEWRKLRENNIQAQKQARLQRCMETHQEGEIHAFCDASTKAYGTILYMVNGDSSSFMVAKARVAPLKQLSVPKLELTSATIAARLVRYALLSYEKEIAFTAIHMWSDSQVTLSWLHSTRKLEPYVHNRVTEIRQLLPHAEWHYVPTKHNPADALTRGLSAKSFLGSQLWKCGPSWLPHHEEWPEHVLNPVSEEAESLSYVTAMVDADEPAGIDRKESLLELARFSKFEKLIRTTARVFKFISLIRKQTTERQLSIENLKEAKAYLVRQAQAEAYREEVRHLKKPARATVPNLVKQLRLFLHDGVIRCQGRLQESTHEWETKYPILLPRKHLFTNLLITSIHQKVQHAGIATVVNTLRLNWWLPHMRQQVKTVIGPCVTCKKVQGAPFHAPLCPPLPKTRLETAPPFFATGVDYTGALMVKNGQNVSKRYIALFTCSQTRAIHLEIVEDNSCEAFMRAFRRFISRRSCPRYMYSDNSTTFTSAAAYLKALYDQPALQSLLQTHNCKWSFIPAKGPWFGGIWERLIGLTKNSLKKVIGRAHITAEELTTIIVEIEAILNDRPITPVSQDLNDDLALTPSQLIYGRRLTTLPQYEIEHDPTFNAPDKLTKRDKHLQSLKTHFWKRWRNEYLLTLREYYVKKNRNPPSAVPQVGEVVLVHEESQRPNWKLAKILELLPGRDGQVRSVKLRTTFGITTRPIVKLYPLEVRVSPEGPKMPEKIRPSPAPNEARTGPRRKAMIAAREQIARQME